MMKRYLLFCQLTLISSATAFGQFTVGEDGIFVSAGTQLFIDGLTLTPSTDFTAASTTLTISPTPIPGSPPSIARVYTFDQPVSFQGSLGFYYQAGELNGNTESSIQLSYGNAGTFFSTTGSTVNTASHYISNTITDAISLDAVTAAQENALPVTLVEFQATRSENATFLNWKTTSEKNSAFFEVQQSTDAQKWNPLGRVTAANESNETQNYFFKDDAFRNGLQYYRLKMVDTDGAFAYSVIRSLHLATGTLASAYPNPAAEIVRVDLTDSAESASLEVINLVGKRFFESTEQQASHQVDMKRFPAGTYLLQLKTTTGKTEVIKIIKQ